MYIIIFICTFIAFALSAISGGGAGLLLIPLLGQFLHITQVPATLSIGTASSSISRLIFFYKNINWKIVKFFLPTALPAAWLGTWLLAYINPLWVELAMAVFLIANLPQIFKKQNKEKNENSQLPNWILLLIGLCAGFISGITGAVGMLFNRFYLKYGLTNNEVVATRAANEILLHIVKIILYIQFGLFSSVVLKIGVVVAVAAILSSWVMKKILPKISIAAFHKVGFSAMVISGFVMLFGFFNKVREEKNATLYTTLRNNGFNSNLTWLEDNYVLEFRWNEGFELEKVINYEDLPKHIQKKVDAIDIPHSKRVFEIVYRLSGRISYEVYLLDEHLNRIDKLKFDKKMED